MKLSLHRLALEVEKLIPRIPNPKRSLEQYTTPGELAALIAWDALMRYPDLMEGIVLDLGCGTGRIMAALLLAGAMRGVCVEGDPSLARLARDSLGEVAARMGAEVLIVNTFIGENRLLPFRKGCCGLIVSNPPFGVWRRGADRAFVEAGLSIAPRVYYAILKSGNLDFHKRVGRRFGYRVRVLASAWFPIPASMSHHRSRIRRVAVDVIAFEREAGGAG